MSDNYYCEYQNWLYQYHPTNYPKTDDVDTSLEAVFRHMVEMSAVIGHETLRVDSEGRVYRPERGWWEHIVDLRTYVKNQRLCEGVQTCWLLELV